MADSGFGGRTLTAFFDTRPDAEAAMVRLTDLGVSDVRITGGEEFAGREDVGRDRGLWESISDFFFPAEDRATYAEGLRRGGFLVTATNVPADHYDDALAVLDSEGSVDLDERVESWRAEGWDHSDVGVARFAALESVEGAGATVTNLAAPVGARVYDTDGLSHDDLGVEREDNVIPIGLGEEEIIPVVRETLHVDKREVSRGRVRVRSWLVEEPLSEEVTLHEERVELRRRPVDRALNGDAYAFIDRTIEAEERAEEVVIRKEARVVEEIALRRFVEDRVHTVSETIRHTEIEIEDDRGRFVREVLTEDPRAH